MFGVVSCQAQLRQPFPNGLRSTAKIMHATGALMESCTVAEGLPDLVLGWGLKLEQ